MISIARTEADALAQYESIISEGAGWHLRAGSALIAIRDQGLYKDGYGTFENYCAQRWEISRQRAYRLIEAAEIAGNLSPIGLQSPENERQVRPLAQIDAEDRAAVWREVVETAPSSGITARHVSAIVKAHLGRQIVPQRDVPKDPISPAPTPAATLRPFFRYPGGKDKLRGPLLESIVSRPHNGEYREPFVGAGSVFLSVLESNRFRRIWINDFDYGIYSVWLSVAHFSEALIDEIRQVRPSVDLFFEYKTMLAGDCRSLPPYAVAAMKIALHQMSFSGLGAKAGGPIGGLRQASMYSVGCRWTPTTIIERVASISDAMRKVEVVVTCADFRSMLGGNGAVIYLDPPYYAKGNDLYAHGLTEDDHRDLAYRLENTDCQWVLSYDRCDEIAALYNWANKGETDQLHQSISLRGTGGEKKARFASEYLIVPREKVVSA